VAAILKEEKKYLFLTISKEKVKVSQTFLKSLVLKKSNMNNTMLKRRYECWHCAIALHVLLGVLRFTVQRTHLLAEKGAKYRIKTASIK
jgi:hypothetical protein